MLGCWAPIGANIATLGIDPSSIPVVQGISNCNNLHHLHLEVYISIIIIIN